MFNKCYKAANNDIETNRALLDKIFKKAEELPEKKSTPVKFYRWGTAVAAVFVVVLAVAVYPQIEKTNEQPQITQIAEKEQKQEVRTVDEASKETISEKPQKTQTAEEFSYETKSSEDVSLDVPQPTAAAEEENINYTMKNNRMAQPETATKEQSALLTDLGEVQEEEKIRLEKLLQQIFFVPEDPNYSFGIASKGIIDGKVFYLGRWSRLVDTHLSRLTDFVLFENMNEMYECEYVEDSIVWSTENNLLDK